MTRSMLVAATIAALLAPSAEAGTLGRAELDALLALGPEDAVTLPGAAFEIESDVRLRRVDVVAPGARTILVQGGRELVLPPSGYRHFRSIDTTGPRVALSIAPGGAKAEGAVISGAQVDALSTGGLSKSGTLTFVRRDAKAKIGGATPIFQCVGALADAGDAPHADDGARVAVPKVAAFQATIAVDTDNEFLAAKFGGNATNATDYLDALFNAMTAIYEANAAQGGLQLRLVRGETTLRSDPDPYAQSGVDAQLDEFADFWRLNKAAVPRAFAMLLSGKSPNNQSASGLAWILSNGNYCNAKGQVISNGVFGHYSVSQVFKFAQQTAANDVGVVAHELGHNFGAFHTHCASLATGNGPASTNTIDQCYAADAAQGCYGGAVSCPVGGVGSLMSYCDYDSPAANCPGSQLAFAAPQVTFLSGRIATNFPSCITAIGETPIFTNSFE